MKPKQAFVVCILKKKGWKLSGHLYSVKISRTELARAPTPAVIESPNAATTCFAVLRDKLVNFLHFCSILLTLLGKVCGTQNGLLKLIDLDSGKGVATTRRNSNYVSDVCVKVTCRALLIPNWLNAHFWPGGYCGCSGLVWWAVKMVLHWRRLQQ